MSGFRNYKKTNNSVESTYQKMFKNQSLQYVLEQKHKYSEFPSIKYDIFDMIERLEDIIDESDPDTELAQINHAYQTAEAIRWRFFKNGKFLNPPVRMLFKIREWNNLPLRIKKFFTNKRIRELYPSIDDWSWLPIVGLIHDLGKVLNFNEWDALPQWSVVGDTFPVGCKINDAVIFNQFHSENKDNNSYDDIGIYNYNCGFDSLHMSWGHDEYLNMVLNKNIQWIKLPEEALYMIRYHSFYSWHTPKTKQRGYTQFADIIDWKRLPLLKILQLSDLYSKNNNLPDIDILREKYKNDAKKWLLKFDFIW
tara:strand:- start:69 stop:995 length:927 start_codon:yes stop_codon:yes gene_type:complete